MKYTKEQAKLRNYVEKKVKQLFIDFPAIAHGYSHVKSVAKRAKQIAIEEKARSIFLCELAGWLHDIGRTRENKKEEVEWNTHHELSYELLKEWFLKDQTFDVLKKSEKKELLYAVRYHWNNYADKYDTAWILRDADKLDMFGKKGIERHIEFHKDEAEINQGLRNAFDSVMWIKTKTAKQMLRDEKLLEPVIAYYKKFLKSKIEPVEL